MRFDSLGIALLVSLAASGCASVGEAVVAGVVGGVVTGVADMAMNHAARSRDAHAPTQASARAVERSHYLTDPVVALVAEGQRVPAVAVSRDGAVVAVVGSGATGAPEIALWDLVARKPVLALKCEAATPRALAFANARSLLAVGGETGAIDLVETTTGNVAATLAGHAGAVLGLAFSSDDATLASAGADGTVRLWDVARQREIGKLVGHSGAVTAVAISGKGARVVSGGSNGTVIVWSMESRSELGRFENVQGGEPRPVSSLAFFPEGDFVACAAGDGLTVFDAELRGNRRSVPSRVLAVAVSPDGKSFAAGQANGRTDCFGLDWRSNEVFCAIDPAVVALAYSTDGKRLVIVGEDGGVYLVAVDGKLVR